MDRSRAEFSKTELRAGALVILSGLVLALIIAAIMNYRPQGSTKHFHVYLKDTGGLDPAADVRFGGIVVGRVTQVRSDPADQSRMRIDVSVSPSTPVNTDSRAYVGQVTLTSARHLELTTGTPSGRLLEDGREIESTIGGMFGDLAGLSQRLEQFLQDFTILLGVSDGDGRRIFQTADGRTIADLFVTLEGVLGDVRVLLGIVDEGGELRDIEGRRTISELMVTMDEAIIEGGDLLGDAREVVAENRDSIREVLAATEEAADSAREMIARLDTMVAENRENIDGAITSAKDVMEDLDGLIARLDTLTGSLQGMVDANDENIETVLQDLSETMRNFREISQTLADQPQALIRGREPVGRQ